MTPTQVIRPKHIVKREPARIAERHEFSAIRIPARPTGPSADEYAVIRATGKRPGKIDRSICGGCGERAWTMVALAGLCCDCYAAALDRRAA